MSGEVNGRSVAGVVAAVAVAVAGSPVSAAPVEWEVDPGHTSLGFRVRHMGVSWTRGTFTGYSARLLLDDTDPSKSSMEVRIRTATVETGLAKRDDHLRSADFFDSQRFPEMVFRSRKVEVTGGRWRVTGDLTIRDVTREVVLDVGELTGPATDPWGNVRRGAVATANLSRKAFGLTWNLVLEAGGLAVGDEVQLTLEVELLRKTARAG